jgi:hypothetical protein
MPQVTASMHTSLTMVHSAFAMQFLLLTMAASVFIDMQVLLLTTVANVFAMQSLVLLMVASAPVATQRN